MPVRLRPRGEVGLSRHGADQKASGKLTRRLDIASFSLVDVASFQPP